MFPYLKLNKIIIIELTETWISNDNSEIFTSILNLGYTLNLAPRRMSRGGEVVFIIGT